jgi:lambda family phage tail tape measure protein/TP901 family phage tail tape measure protein
MSFANSKDLTFVLKMRDRMSAGLKKSQAGFKSIGAEIRQAAKDAAFLSQTVMGVRFNLDAATQSALKFTQTMALRGATTGLTALAGAAQLMATTLAGTNVLSVIKLGSAIGLLPKFLGNAARAADLFSGKFDFIGKFLERLQTSKNPFLKFVGWTAAPIAQLGTMNLLLMKLRPLADMEMKLFQRPMAIGPMVASLEEFISKLSGDLLTGVDRASNGLFSLIQRLDGVKRAFETITGPMGQAVFSLTTLVASIKGLSDLRAFDKEFQNAFTVGGADINFASGIKKQLAEIALESGRRMPEVAAAFTIISGAGYEGEEALDILRKSAQGAAAGLGEVADVASFLMPVMKLYSDEVGNAEVASDRLLAAVQQGMGDAKDFARNFGQVFGIARQAGVSFDELISATSTLTLSGMNASEAVTSLRQSITDAIGPSRQGLNILAKYGMTLEDMQKMVRDDGIVATVAAMEKRLSMLDFQRLFDQVQGRQGMLQLSNDLKEELAQVTQAVAEDSVGAMAEAFDTLQNSSFFAMERVLTGINNLFIELGSFIAPSVNSALNFMADNYDAVRDAIKQVFVSLTGLFFLGKLGPMLADGLISGFQLFGRVATIALDSVSAAANFMFGNFFKNLNLLVMQVDDTIVASFKMIAAMFRQGTFFTNLRIAAVRAMVGIQVAAAQTGRYIMLGLTNPMAAARIAAAALAKVLPMVARGIAAVGAAIKTALGIALRTLAGVLGFVLGMLLEFLLYITMFGDQMEWTFSKVGGEVVAWSDVMWGTFDWLGAQISAIIQTVIGKFGEWTGSMQPVLDVIGAGLSWLLQQFAFVASKIGDLIQFIVTAFGAMAAAVGDSAMLIIDVIMEMADVVANVFAGIWGAIEKTFQGDLEGAGKAMMDGLSKAVDPDRIAARLASMATHGAEVGRAWSESFNNSAVEAAVVAAGSWDAYVLARKAGREARDKIGPDSGGKLVPQGIPQPDGEQFGDNKADKDFANTLAKLHASVEETYRFVEANELWGAAVDAGTDGLLRASTGFVPLIERAEHLALIDQKRVEISEQLVANGQAGKFTQEQILQGAMIAAAVEAKQRREAELKLESFTLMREEAERIAKVQQDSNLSPADREAAIAAIQREIEIRKERYQLNDAEIEGIRKTTFAEQKLRAIIDTTQKMQDMRRETEVMQQLLGLRYESSEQYAVETARIQATAEMRKKHGDALGKEAQQYIAAAEEQARVQSKLDNRTPSVMEALSKKWEEWQRQTKDIGTTIADVATNSVDRMADAFSEFFMGQKVSWRDFANDVIKQIMRMITQMLIMQAIQAAIGLFSGGGTAASSVAGATSAGAAKAGGLGALLKSANGNVFGAARKFAKGSAFANSVVSNPTLFAFKDGGVPNMGLMGEAGPEAVMPLKRLAGGRLGVSADMRGGGSQVVNVDARTTIVIEMKEVSDPAAAQRQAQEMGQMFKSLLDQRDQQQQIKLARASRSLTHGGR